MKNYKPEVINLKNNPKYNEAWVQNCIAEDPSILNLGDLILRDKERPQPNAGRLDLLLQDTNTDRRYEVEVQLGRTDESHIIRTIEYYDIEKSRYPQYDHCAVIVAEEITGRFLNVIKLFNGHIPIIAIQMKAYLFEDKPALIFTTVVDEIPLGLVEEDEGIAEIADRNYWLKRSTEKSVKLADSMLSIIKKLDPEYEITYKKFFIGLAKDGSANNFISFKPRKSFVNLQIKLPYSDEIQNKINDSELDDIGYDRTYGRYRLKISNENEIDKNRELLEELIKLAYENSN